MEHDAYVANILELPAFLLRQGEIPEPQSRRQCTGRRRSLAAPWGIRWRLGRWGRGLRAGQARTVGLHAAGGAQAGAAGWRGEGAGNAACAIGPSGLPYALGPGPTAGTALLTAGQRTVRSCQPPPIPQAIPRCASAGWAANGCALWSACHVPDGHAVGGAVEAPQHRRPPRYRYGAHVAPGSEWCGPGGRQLRQDAAAIRPTLEAPDEAATCIGRQVVRDGSLPHACGVALAMAPQTYPDVRGPEALQTDRAFGVRWSPAGRRGPPA